MIPTHHIIQLILDNGYYEGKYVNGHGLLVSLLIDGCDELSNYHIEVVDTIDHVRVWSKDGWIKEQQRRANAPRLVNKSTVDPLIIELRAAIEAEDFVKVMQIKQRMKENEQNKTT